MQLGVMLPSRRERAKIEKENELRTANGVLVGEKSCQAVHPTLGKQCWHSKPHGEEKQHVVVVGKQGGGFEKHYWRG